MDTQEGVGAGPAVGIPRRRQQLACAMVRCGRLRVRANTIMRLEGGWKEGLLGALYSGWECLAMGNTRISDEKGWAGQTWAGWEEKNCAKVHWRSQHKEYLRFTRDGSVG